MDTIFNISIIELLGSAAGGFVGAAFGGLVAFVFCGVAILIGIAIVICNHDPIFLNLVGLGPFFGPHISFAAGVAAAAYASHKGYLKDGRDIVTPLISLNKANVLWMGSFFGVLGYLLQTIMEKTHWIGSYTNSVALTVVIIGLIARLWFSKSGIVGEHHLRERGISRFKPCNQHFWLPYQDGFPMTITVGVFFGALSSWSSIVLLQTYPDSPSVILLGFSISAISLIFIAMNMSVPVTHHITLVSAVAVSSFLNIIHDNISLLIIGTVSGLITAIIGQIFSRFWLIRANTYIDPPASSIWPMTTIIILLSSFIK